MRQWLLLPLKIIICNIHKALVQARKTEKSDSKPQNSNSNEQSSPEPLVVPKLERGSCLWWNKLLCHKLCVWFLPPMSFWGGKHDGKLLQNSSIYPPPLLIHSLTWLCASIQLYVTCTATCASFTPTRIFQQLVVTINEIMWLVHVSV